MDARECYEKCFRFYRMQNQIRQLCREADPEHYDHRGNRVCDDPDAIWLEEYEQMAALLHDEIRKVPFFFHSAAQQAAPQVFYFDPARRDGTDEDDDEDDEDDELGTGDCPICLESMHRYGMLPSRCPSCGAER